MKDILYDFMAFLGVLIMFINVLKIYRIELKNKNNNQMLSKTRYIKFTILGLIIYVTSRILYGQIL